MEEKYNPERIHSYTATHFSLIFKNIKFKKLAIRIEIKETNNRCYTIGTTKERLTDMVEGSCETIHGLTRIRNRFELSNNRNSLGKVTVWHEGKQIHDPFPTYDEFWNTIKPEK